MKTTRFTLSLVALSLCAAPLPLLADFQEHWQKAQSFLQKNDPKSAIIELRNALQEDGKNVQARVLLGELYLKEGNLGAAEKELDKARTLGGERALWVKPLGRTYISMYIPQKVLEVVTEYAKDANELKADVLGLRALAELQMGRLDEAEKLAQAAVSLNPKQTDAVFTQAQLARFKSELDKAESLVNEAIRNEPAFVQPYMLSAEILMNRQQPEKALERMNIAVDKAPNDLRIRLARAEIQLSQKHTKEAWQDINLVLGVVPKHPTALYLKAKALLLEDKTLEATDALNESIAIMPQYIEAQLLLGFIHNRNGKFQQAAQALEPVVGSRPSYLPAVKLLAATKIGLKDADGALNLANSGLKSAPQDLQFLALKANALVLRKEFDAAEAVMQQALAIAPDANHLRTSLALLQLQEGNAASAIDQLQIASEKTAGFDMSELMLVSAYLSQKQHDKAEALASKLYRENEKNALVANLYGVVKMAQKDELRAKRYFEEAERIDPNFINAAINLARIDVTNKDFAAAHKRVDALIQKQPKSSVLAAHKAGLYDVSGEPQKGLEWLKKSWELDRTNHTSGNAYLRRLVLNGNAMEAVAVGQQMVASAGERAEAHISLAFAQQANKAYGQAVNSYQRALEIDPNSIEAMFGLSDTQQKNGEPDQAYRTLERLHRQQPKMIQPMVAMGRLDYNKQDLDNAQKWATKLVSEHADNAAGYQLKADVLFAKKQYKEAASGYEQAYAKQNAGMTAAQWSNVLRLAGDKAADKPLKNHIAKYPKDDDAKFALASIYLSSGKANEALAIFKDLEVRHAEHPIVLNNLTWMYAEQKDAANAQKYLAKMEKMAPKEPELLDTMGYASLQLGDAKKALGFLNKAIEVKPSFAEARYHAAQAHKALGNNAAAKEVLKPAIESKQVFGSRAEAEKMYQSL